MTRTISLNLKDISLSFDDEILSFRTVPVKLCYILESHGPIQYPIVHLSYHFVCQEREKQVSLAQPWVL